ncbi:cyclic lactone autoinducer peptide [Enterococcus rotai]|uniref:Cyclic lactone autoinducer peptide n=1 Tax=Enterococcus moraviensis ATCC BAA-383 TaxID=1158609 RepID=R2STE5_9ENTE|nr:MULTISPECIES: cyclic lactone autoinducer peptide [Enterococcus]EOH96096.1 cyclic lactone autoinducer peptide [Enterococcus moraviensis ATCC BAA-383]EOT66068.1 hypothetical protein I586_02339 [Enterococcus moraviensis ATCC BAA-383]
MIGQLLERLGTLNIEYFCIGLCYEPKIPKELMDVEE